jgi:hypothetical protein
LCPPQVSTPSRGAGRPKTLRRFRLDGATERTAKTYPAGMPGRLDLVLSAAAIIAVFAPLTVVRYRRLARR